MIHFSPWNNKLCTTEEMEYLTEQFINFTDFYQLHIFRDPLQL